MDIRTLSLSELNPAPYNPRKDLTPDDPEYQKIRRSLDAFGLVEPLVWNERTRTLVGGHQRLKVLRDLGYTEAEVSVVDLDLEHEQALNIALNKITGEWEFGQLAIVLEGLSFEVAGLTGFDPREMQGLIEQMHAEEAITGFVRDVSFKAKDGAKPPTTEYVQLTYAVTIAQKNAIQEGIKRARLKMGLTENAAALAAICEAYK